MRRLAIFFVLDVSESMAGENLYALEQAVGAVLSKLRKDPYALETVFISVIAFAGAARTLTPLTELTQVNAPELPVGGGTGLGVALTELMRALDAQVVKGSPDRKGDWRPVVFLMTDGRPTDDPRAAIDRWNRDYRARVHLVAVSVGGGADHALLQTLSDDVLVLQDADPAAFTRFVEWVTLSVQAQSRSVSAGGDAKLSLAKTGESIERLDLAKHTPSGGGVDERYAVLIGKCSRQKLPYLIKYERAPTVGMEDARMAERLGLAKYQLRATYPLKPSYFELCAADGGKAPEVSSEELLGQPNCPHCGAAYGLAVCGCRQVHCVTGEGKATCPWCGNVGMYGGSADGFDIARGRG